MAHEITVNVSTPTEELTISGYPDGVVITDVSAASPYVVAEPSNTLNVLGESGATIVTANTYADNSADVINIGAQLNVTIGTLLESPVASELDGFKYAFPNFVDAGITTTIFGPTHKFGDVVFLKSDLSDTANEWGAVCKTADVNDIDKGAYNNLFIFISHINNTLIILQKGFFDLEDENISQWTAGRGLYLDDDNLFDITPTSSSGNWIRSLGYCVPNNNNKKRVWFDPDSTYIKII